MRGVHVVFIIIGLFGMAQGGWGTTTAETNEPVIVDNWYDLISNDCSTEDPANIYTLNKYSEYRLRITEIPDTGDCIKLIIPSGITVTNITTMSVNAALTLSGDATFTR